MDIDPGNANLYVGESGFGPEVLQFFSGWCLPRSAEANGRFVTDESVECFPDGTIINPGTAPYAEREPPARAQHATHLLQRNDFIRKELEALLAENDIEAGIVQPESECATLKPLNQFITRRKRSLDCD